MILSGLKGNELISLATPMLSEGAEYTLVNLGNPSESTERYRIQFKGPTAVKVERTLTGKGDEGYYKGQDAHDWYRLFRREHMQSTEAPQKPLPSYVHGKRLVHWSVV